MARRRVSLSQALLPNEVDWRPCRPRRNTRPYSQKRTCCGDYLGSLPEGMFLNWNPQPTTRKAITISKPRSQRFQSGELLANRSFPPPVDRDKIYLRLYETQYADRPPINVKTLPP